MLDDVGRRRAGWRGVGLRRRRVVAVTEPAAAGLAAQPACFHHGALQQRRREPRVVAERGPHQPGHRLVHVLPDQVHQRERPHPEPARPGQHRVDGGRAGGPLLGQPQRLGVERPRHPVHDEPGRRGRLDDLLAPVLGQPGDGRRDGGVGGQAADHLDQPHHRRRVEEMQAHQASGVAEPGRDGGRRQRGGVGGQHAVRCDDLLQVGEQGLLDGQVLGHRLDHAPGPGQLAEVGGHLRPRSTGPRSSRPLSTSRATRSRIAVDRPPGDALGSVVHDDRMAGHRGDLRDPGPHGAGPDDGDGRGPADSITADTGPPA